MSETYPEQCNPPKPPAPQIPLDSESRGYPQKLKTSCQSIFR